MTRRAAHLLAGASVALVVGPWLGGSAAFAEGAAGAAPEGEAAASPVVEFADACASIDVKLTAASGGTDFAVTPPGAAAVETVHVDTTAVRSYAVDPQHLSVAVTWAGNDAPLTHSWVQPKGCVTAQPVADPAVTFADSCLTGVSVTLTNLAVDDTTTAPVTFTVTTPRGATKHVLVRADQIVRLVFPVKEDTTATVRVSAPGLPVKVHRYQKDCTHVLGEKIVHSPASGGSPAAGVPSSAGGAATSGAAVAGSRVVRATAQLPFTGLPTGPAAALGIALLGLGAALTAAGRRRTPQQTRG